MPYSTVPKIGEGSQLAFEDSGNPGTYLELDEATGNGPVGTVASFVDATPLRAPAPRQIPGVQEPVTGEFIFYDVPSNANLATFLAHAESYDTINMRQTRSTGRQIDFQVTLSGREFMAQERGEPDKIRVPYTQIGTETESEV